MHQNRPTFLAGLYPDSLGAWRSPHPLGGFIGYGMERKRLKERKRGRKQKGNARGI